MELKNIQAKKAYFDTNVFIYLIEEHPEYQQRILDLITHLENIDCKIFTSELTLAECLVKPYAENDIDSQNNYKESIITSDFLTVEIVNREVLIEASRLRALYKNKLPDSIHLASAVLSNCDLFIGNDKKIKAGDNIEIFNL